MSTNYREDQQEIIENLEKQLAETTVRQSDAKAQVSAATNALKLATDKNAADQNQKNTVQSNYSLTQTAISSIDLASEISGGKEGAGEITTTIFSDIETMVQAVYETVELTAEVAEQAVELNAMIEEAKKENSLISDLLVKDAANLSTEATKALSDGIAALDSSVTALDSAAKAVQDIESVNAYLNDLASQGQWLSKKLSDMLENAIKTEEASAEAKAEANETLEQENQALEKANADLASDTAALTAAKTATGQG